MPRPATSHDKVRTNCSTASRIDAWLQPKVPAPPATSAALAATRRNSRRWLDITGWNDGRGFDHEDDGSIRGPSSMHDALGNHEALSLLQVDRLVFQIDDEVAIEHEEKLVVVVVLVPMVLTLHDAQTDNGIVDLAKRLVVPLIRASLYESR